eukprot:352766-Chlamydomonas_euryale.AAC.2
MKFHQVKTRRCEVYSPQTVSAKAKGFRQDAVVRVLLTRALEAVVCRSLVSRPAPSAVSQANTCALCACTDYARAPPVAPTLLTARCRDKTCWILYVCALRCFRFRFNPGCRPCHAARPANDDRSGSGSGSNCGSPTCRPSLAAQELAAATAPPSCAAQQERAPGPLDTAHSPSLQHSIVPEMSNPRQQQGGSDAPTPSTAAGPHATSPPQQQHGSQAPSSGGGSEPPQPCTLGAIGSAIPSGILGWFFGLVPSAVRHRKLRMWRTWLDDAGASGRNLMLFSGVYSLAHCLVTRMRQVDDGWSRGAAGCATGLAVGWSGGPAAAGQSCVAIGLVSSLIDLGTLGGESPAKAAVEMIAGGGCHGSGCGVALGDHVVHAHARMAPAHGVRASSMRSLRRRMHAVAHADAGGPLGMPPVMWLGALSHAASNGYLVGAPSRVDSW